MCCPCTLGCVAFYHSVVHLPGPALFKKAAPPSQQLPVVSSSLASGRTPCSLPFSMLGGQSDLSPSLVQSQTLNSYVQLACCVPKTLFPRSHLSPWLLHYPCPSTAMIPESRKRLGCDTDVPSRAEHSLLSYNCPVLISRGHFRAFSPELRQGAVTSR